MQNIEKAANALVNEILNTKEYEKYLFYRDKMNDNPELKSRLDSYKRERLAYELSGKNNPELENGLAQEYFRLLSNDDCASLIEYENRVASLIGNILDTIAVKTDLDLSFLEQNYENRYV